MSIKKILTGAIFLAAMALSVTAGCQPSRPPAQFDVSPLSFEPAQATTGETISVSAEVSNNGGMEGVYRAKLSIEGTNMQTQEIDLAPGTSQAVNFQFFRDKPGTYEIAIGKSSASYTVGPKLMQQEEELKNDNSIMKDFLSVVKPFTGYLEGFTAPAGAFTISAVRVDGLIYGGHDFEIKDLELQILDKDKKALFRQTYPGNKFPILTFLTGNFETQGAWVDLNVPDIAVQGDFYVHIYAGPNMGQGFRLGASDSLGNTHSDLTIRDSNGMDNTSSGWPYSMANWYGDKNRVNWLVHVVGSAMVPSE